MRVLTYRHLDPRPVQAQFDKVHAALERGDLFSAGVKKLTGSPYYRAKLDDTNRLLLTFRRYQGETVCLLLEVIPYHRYEKSRFLRGARVQEDHIEVRTLGDVQTPEGDLRYVHPTSQAFHVLDKFVSFDEAQEAIYHLPSPVVIVGSAGSGKTALTLEKLRAQPGRVLYVTLSPYLAQQAQQLYRHSGPEDAEQDASFLSFAQLLETVRVPQGREVTFPAFRAWLSRHQQAARFTDAHALFEEFRGVLSSSPEGPLSLTAYLALGVRQSLYADTEREAAHALFGKYQAWLRGAGLYDPNLAAFERLPLAEPSADFLIVDEVQDFTPVQLALALRTLKDPTRFLLCGDANQVVHPNFFSWAAVRGLFWSDDNVNVPLSVIHANFRNAREITRVANRLLRIKQARFGSVDRESTQLADANAAHDGRVEVLSATGDVLKRLNDATAQSARYAVIVLRDEDKADARRVFKTPLVFSVHEAKGLEYEGVILHNLISSQRQAYAAVADGITPEGLTGDDLTYRRARDKSDKSLERFKFFVNALYVALTRGVEHVMLVEQDVGHPLVGLLQVQEAGEQVSVQAKVSSAQEWAAEAGRLRAQGKTEQADAILKDVLKLKPVPWEVMDGERLAELQSDVLFDLAGEAVTERQRRSMLEQAVWHEQAYPIRKLAEDHQYGPAARMADHGPRRMQAHVEVRHKELAEYTKKNTKWVHWACDTHGLDHRNRMNATPLMLAALAGNAALVGELLKRGADPDLTDHFGHTAVMYAVGRAMYDPVYRTGAVAGIYELLAPPHLDVQVEGRLMRLNRGQGEYTVLLRMLSGMKAQCFRLDGPDETDGFTAGQLTWEDLPETAAPELGMGKAYISSVLARAEVDGTYRPARRLWWRMSHGAYLPNPDLHLRVDVDGERVWRPLHDAMGLHLVDLPHVFYPKARAVQVRQLRPLRPVDDPLLRASTPGAMVESLFNLDSQYVLAEDIRTVFFAATRPGGVQLNVHDRTSIIRGANIMPLHVQHALRNLIGVRLGIPNEAGEVSLLADDGRRQIVVLGPVTALSDQALHLMLAWQKWREPEALDETAVAELRAHGFSGVVNDLLGGACGVPAYLQAHDVNKDDPDHLWVDDDEMDRARDAALAFTLLEALEDACITEADGKSVQVIMSGGTGVMVFQPPLGGAAW